MRFILFFVLFAVLSIAYANDDSVPLPYGDEEYGHFLPLSPKEMNYERNFLYAMNLGARNLTLDAINKGHIPAGTYRISNVLSAELYRSDYLSAEEVNDYGYNTFYNDGGLGPRRYARFVVEITNDGGSGLYANFTIFPFEGDRYVYHYYIAQYSYTWFTNEAEGHCEDNEFEFVLEQAWYEFAWGEEVDIEAEMVGYEADATDDTDFDEVVIIAERDGKTEEFTAEWGNNDDKKE